MKTRFPILLFCSLSFMLTGCAASDWMKIATEAGWENPRKDWPSPNPGTIQGNLIRNQISEQMDKHLIACGIPEGTQKNFVPNNILSLANDILKKEGEPLDIAGGLLLYYVFSDDERKVVLNSDKLSLTKFIDISQINAPLVVDPVVGFDSWLIRRTCTGFLTGEIAANGQVPVASLRAAVDADLNRKSAIELISGRFASPFISILDGSDWRTSYVRFSLINIYERNKNLANNAYYLADFSGIMIRGLKGASYSGNIKVDGKIDVPSLTAKLDAGFSFGDTIQATNWQTIMVSDIGDMTSRLSRFEKLPSLSELTNSVSNIGYTAKIEPLKRTMKNNTQITIPGVPKSICSSVEKKWTFNPDAGSIKFKAPVYVQAYNQIQGDVPVCVINISGDPQDEYFTGSPSNNIYLKGGVSLNTSTPITFKINERLTIAPLPVVRLVSKPGLINDYQTTGDAGATENKLYISWARKVQFVEPAIGEKVDWDNPDFSISPVKTTCGNIPLEIQSDSISINTKEGFDVMFKNLASIPLEKFSPQSIKPCKIDTEISFNIIGSRSIKLPLSFDLPLPFNVN